MLRILVAAFALVPVAASAQAVHDAKPDWTGPVAGSGWIDLEPDEGGHLVIPVMLNGEHAWALIDTGFENMTLSKRWADAHGLSLIPWGTALSVGGRTAFFYARGVSMSIGAIRTKEPSTFVAVDLASTPPVAGHAVDVIIGLDLLAHVGWEVDQDARRFRIVAGGSLPVEGAGTVRRGPDGARLVTDIRLGASPPVAAEIDTGSDDALAVTSEAAAAAHARIVTDLGGWGAGGELITPVAAAGPIGIAGQRVEGLLLTVATPGSGVIQPHIPAVVGMGLLGRYNLRIDPVRGRLDLGTRTKAPPPPAKSTLGVQGGVSDGRLTIVHVMLNSPAASAGLKAGDAICAVNDRPVAEADARHWGRAAPGTRYALHLCDGRTVPLVTRAFY